MYVDTKQGIVQKRNNKFIIGPYSHLNRITNDFDSFSYDVDYQVINKSRKGLNLSSKSVSSVTRKL